MSDSIPGREEIEMAVSRIATFAHRTPVYTSRSVNAMLGADICFKCENLQRGGAFKIRGASNAIMSLTEGQRRHGVATHSSGNHAQAVAIVAKELGIPAYIVMPSNAPLQKKQAVAGYGAEIIECQPNLQAREDTLRQVRARTSAAFIHPYNDYRIIAGQASACRELLEDTGQVDCVLAPVGGGGLLSGTALAAAYYATGVDVYGCEPIGADDAYRSLKAGHIIPSVEPRTLADGLLTSLGEKTFEIIQNHVRDIITVNDDMILAAMQLLWERMKLVVEPSGAVALACLMGQRKLFAGKKVGVIISGGNIRFPALSAQQREDG